MSDMISQTKERKKKEKGAGTSMIAYKVNRRIIPPLITIAQRRWLAGWLAGTPNRPALTNRRWDAALWQYGWPISCCNHARRERRWLTDWLTTLQKAGGTSPRKCQELLAKSDNDALHRAARRREGKGRLPLHCADCVECNDERARFVCENVIFMFSRNWFLKESPARGSR